MFTPQLTIELTYHGYGGQTVFVDTNEHAQEILDQLLQAINKGDKAFRIIDRIVSLDNVRGIKIGSFVMETPSHRISESEF